MTFVTSTPSTNAELQAIGDALNRIRSLVLNQGVSSASLETAGHVLLELCGRGVAVMPPFSSRTFVVSVEE